MSDQSSFLVEKLWQLKRRVDKGQCPGVDFVHLNVLLREPVYRADVLRRVEANGSPELRALARDIMAGDNGQSLLGQSSDPDYQTLSPNARPRRRWFGRRAMVLVPTLVVGLAIAAGFTAFENRAIRINTDITTDTVWESGNRYILEDRIFVKNAELTIESGVTVEGEPGSALIVAQSARLFARGSRQEPVVFTSAKPEGERARGDWGGVVLLGKAPVNETDARIEGLSETDERGRFGGSDEQHSCGVIQYTRIEFAGFEVYKNNELNGLTLGGCGSNTIVQNVQVHRALDDGIEMFGGTVDLKHILVTGAADDSIDWDWGWRGRVQFAVIQQHPDTGDHAFEGDNNGDNHDALPRSAPTFHNVTVYGNGHAAKKHRAVLLREGSGGHFHNMIIDSYAIEVMDTRDDVLSLVEAGELTFSHNVLANNNGLDRRSTEVGADDDDAGFDEVQWLTGPSHKNTLMSASALHPTVSNAGAPHFRSRGLPTNVISKTLPKSEFFDESADYPGAINPRASSTWLDDWTAYPEA